MEQLVFDSGIREYRINDGGALRFNPSDPNLYTRFRNAMDSIKAVQTELAAKAEGLAPGADPQESGEAVLTLMWEADRRIKDILTQVFGPGNDLDAALGGVNLLAVATNGQRVIENLLNALQPVLVEGAERYVRQQVQAAKIRREQRL